MELLLLLFAFLVGIVVCALFLLGLFWVITVLRERNEKLLQEASEEPVAPVSLAFDGFREARRRHPLPEAKSDLEAAEIAGPIYVHRPECVVQGRRAS
jgi:Tfp pilus assembly protein PilN